VLVLLQLPLGPGLALAVGLPFGIWCLTWLSVYGTSSWILRVVRELDQARGTAARLAVAEERLRFSRDLHDVFGRVLATVAVKSELAAELASRRPDEAAEAMFEVRRLAQDSLTEVRAVAAGYRHADLGHELRGARGLLDSAGITCSVLGEELTLPEHVRTAFGWVVREAVTNVIRHSAATQCTISVSRAAAWSRLEVINNGVTAESVDGGSGLTGLAERLAPLGGRLEARRSNDTFTLLVTLPNEDRS
jgi:two-component system sensor histidine kinase DesK